MAYVPYNGCGLRFQTRKLHAATTICTEDCIQMYICTRPFVADLCRLYTAVKVKSLSRNYRVIEYELSIFLWLPELSGVSSALCQLCRFCSLVNQID